MVVEICAFSLLPFTPLTHFVQLRLKREILFPFNKTKMKKNCLLPIAEAETMAETARMQKQRKRS